MLAQRTGGLIFTALLALVITGSRDESRAQDHIVSKTVGPFTVDSDGMGQLSSEVFEIPVRTTSVLEAEYTASPGHCSPVKMHFLVDGIEEAVSGALQPGESSGFFDLGPVPPGAYTVELQAEGIEEGCNTGSLANWGGTATVRFSVGSTAAPALSRWAMAVLCFALVLFAWLRQRRQSLSR
jgi:hypothetical protein